MNAVLTSGARVMPLRAEDLDEIRKAERELYEFPWTMGNFRDSLAAGYSGFALRADDRLLGYAIMMFTPDEAHLLNLSVVASAQRQGCGTALLQVLIEFARARGAVRMFLEVRPSNAGARRLYERIGFKMAGVRTGYYPARRGREKAPAAICRKVAQAKLSGQHEIEIWGDGEQTRSFMYIDDCLLGTMKIMHSDILDPINLGSAELVTINELVDIVEDIAGIHLTRRYNLDAPKGVRGRNSDNTRILERLGWEPSTPLAEGMEKTYAWIYDQLVASSPVGRQTVRS